MVAIHIRLVRSMGTADTFAGTGIPAQATTLYKTGADISLAGTSRGNGTEGGGKEKEGP